MAAGRQMWVIGIRAIDKKLRKLETKVQRKVLVRSMRAGMKLVAEETRNQAPVDTGLMKRSIKVRAIKRSRKRVGIDVRISGKQEPGLYRTSSVTGKKVWYPAIVEYGRKNVPPNAFMRRAFVAKGEQARQVTLKALLDGVEEEARKL